MTPQERGRYLELRLILAARDFVRGELREHDPLKRLTVAVDELATWHGSDTHLLGDLDQELGGLHWEPEPPLPDEQMLEAMEQQELWADDLGAGPRWIPATFADCLAGDHIRIGTEETDVLRANRGIWHADARDEWRPKAWQHLEVRLELAAVGGFPVYPPAQAIEILMTPERHAVHTLAQAFPGSTVQSEVVR